MVSRGEVGLIVASVGISQGLMDSDLFSAIVAMVLITTLVTPPILRSLFRQEPQIDSKTSSETEQTNPNIEEAA